LKEALSAAFYSPNQVVSKKVKRKTQKTLFSELLEMSLKYGLPAF
jgi:hypothetical protein